MSTPAAATEPYEDAREVIGPGFVRRYRIEVVDGPAAPVEYETVAERCAIGSSGSCDLAIADPTVSHFHCEIVCEGAHVRIRDLGSRNGTIVSGVAIESAFLRSGAMIHIGRTVLVFRRLDQVEPLELSARQEFGRLVGRSVTMRAIFSRLERAAASPAKVLLQGESGTGKTLTAESIHMESARREHPFVTVDCGALPDTLLESEFFGHVKGAFTGAISDRMGAFERANGGTLFLDEIGEVPLSLQAKLLRVLDRGEIQRVGDDRHKPRRVDVRVITATNRDLRAAVNRREFREDLYYRIAVLVIRLPSLRERLEDLSYLAHALLARSKYPESEWRALLSDDFMARLRTGAWPGNIRELANYLERCVVYSRPQPIEARESSQPDGTVAVDLEAPWVEAKEAAHEHVERYYFGELLRIHGSVARAARVAGVYPSTYYKKLRAHGIAPGGDR